MKKHIFSWMAWLFPLILWGNLPKDPADYAAWEQKMLSSVEVQKGRPPEIAIPKLGEWVSQLSHGANIEAGQRPVFHTAQAALLAIPGHANYYRDEIETMRERVTENASLSEKEQDRLRRERKLVGPGDYDDVRERAFTVLGLLPSHETVAVLGHFLEDPENRAPKNYSNDDWMPYPPNCAAAYIAISNLGIEQPAIQGDKPEPGERQFDIAKVDAWKDWWEEVKAGRKSFSFLGQKVEYRFKPDGTWDTMPIANPPDDAPEPVVAQSPVKSPPTSPASQTLSPSGNSWAWIVGATMIMLAVVVAAVAGLVLRLRRKAGSGGN